MAFGPVVGIVPICVLEVIVFGFVGFSYSAIFKSLPLLKSPGKVETGMKVMTWIWLQIFSSNFLVRPTMSTKTKHSLLNSESALY